jgi:hypothetical protein
MPKGPKRPADVVGAAIRVARISGGDHQEAPPSPAQQLGKLGGAARAKKLTREQRVEIAKKAAARRWKK